MNIPLLQRVEDSQGGQGGWVTVAVGLDARSAGPLVKHGLLREASTEDRAELSARAGRPVRWAVQVTADGRDVLAYARQCAVVPVHEPPEPGLQKVALRRGDLDILKRFVALGGQLTEEPSLGLASAVETARFDAASNRWIVYVDGGQMKSMARAFFLERHGGASGSGPANRFARVYGVIYPPQGMEFTAQAQYRRAPWL
ncbi:DUF6417 family protein [Streptomyces sp. NPDC049813]|uniref:DUF6417 family protein n=1 Tax=Streptomyces sp. NPDC049813 TaxID=3365597 RepID=UPI0037B92D6A